MLKKGLYYKSRTVLFKKVYLVLLKSLEGIVHPKNYFSSKLPIIVLMLYVLIVLMLNLK